MGKEKKKGKRSSTGSKQQHHKKTSKKKKKSTAIKHSSPTKSNIALSFIWNLVFYLMMFSILIGAGFLAMMQQQGKSLNGYRIFGVLTDSMVSPNNTLKKGGFRSGSILITKEVPPEDIKVGDVITYKPSTNPTNKSTNYLTHRVVKVKSELNGEEGIYFVTRGDANKTDDMPISSRALIGKEVFVIPAIGGVLTFIKENGLVSIIFIVSMIGFVWIVKNQILVPNEVNDKKKKKKRKS